MRALRFISLALIAPSVVMVVVSGPPPPWATNRPSAVADVAVIVPAPE